MLTWGLMAALGAILLALPSALITRFTPRFDLLGWAASVILAILVELVLFGGQLQSSLAVADYMGFRAALWIAGGVVSGVTPD